MAFLLLQQPQDSLSMALASKYEELAAMSGAERWDLIIDKLTSIGLKILAAILIYLIGAWLIRRVRKLMKKIFLKRSTDPSLSGFLLSFVNIALTVLLFVIVVTTLGVPASTFAALVAAGGLAVGMALSGTLQNFAGGVMILLFKPFKVGDYIDAAGFSGTVDIIKITSTQIHTVDNKIVVLPNGTLSNGNIQNYSSSETRRVDWNITISYGDDVEKAKEVIMGIISANGRILTEPEAPFFALAALGANGITITTRVWVKSGDYWDVFFDVNKRIYQDFPAKGLRFPLPQMEVSVKK